MTVTSPAPKLAQSFASACHRWADRPAITHRGRTVSYGELWQQVIALAGSYERLGIGAGDRVVCQLPNCPEHVVAMAAAWVCGAVHLGIDRDLTGREVAELVGRTDAAALVVQPPADCDDHDAALRAVRLARPGIRVIVHETGVPEGGFHLGALMEGGAHGLTDSVRTEPDPTQMGLLLMTSGTTGRPKLVGETLQGCWGKMQYFADAFSPGPDDVHLVSLPICHGFGMRMALTALMCGGRVVLGDRFSPAEALALLVDEGVTVLPGTPTHFTLLLRALDEGSGQVPALRYVISSAAVLPPQLAAAVEKRLGARLLLVYGCVEGFTVVTSDPEVIRRGSVGRCVYRGPLGTAPDGSVAVVDPDTHTPLPPGEIGEIAFGSRRPIRYLDEPDVASDGWYYTGDLGRVDPDGCVFVLGRLKELINRGGLKVSPTEIEKAIAEHPDIGDAAIVATPHPVLGEAICACVVPAGANRLSLVEIRAFLRERLARHKMPDELCCVSKVPRTKLGKVDRAALLSLVMSDVPREKLRA